MTVIHVVFFCSHLVDDVMALIRYVSKAPQFAAIKSLPFFISGSTFTVLVVEFYFLLLL